MCGTISHLELPELHHSVLSPRPSAISFLTGYMVRVDPDDANNCILTYVTQSDAKGWIPGWVMNQATKTFAPKLIEKISSVAPKYPAWKAQNNPDSKPWYACLPMTSLVSMANKIFIGCRMSRLIG